MDDEAEPKCKECGSESDVAFIRGVPLCRRCYLGGRDLRRPPTSKP